MRAGAGGGCGIRPDGALVCWGAVRQPPELRGAFADVSVQGEVVCGLRVDGALLCGGPGAPAAVPGRFAALAGPCGVRGDGTRVCRGGPALPFGEALQFRQLQVTGDALAGLLRDGRLVLAARHPLPAAALEPWTTVSLTDGGDTACGLRPDGGLACAAGPGRLSFLTYGPAPFVELAGDCVRAGAGHVWCLDGAGAASPLVAPRRFAELAPGRRVRPARGEWLDAARGVTAIGEWRRPPHGPWACGVTVSGEVRCRAPGHCALGGRPVDALAGACPEVPAGGGFVQAVSGVEHACALHEGGSLRCWSMPAPGAAVAPDVPAGRFQAVVSGAEHACALDAAGRVHCWGAPAPAGRFVALTAEGARTCAVRADGRLQCWGGPEASQAAR